MATDGVRIQQNSPEGAAEGLTGKKGKVCVTGGAGFVASWLVKKLLERGYSVRATVRSDPNLKKEWGHLTNLPGASDNLEIFDADLARPESFAPAIEGCVGVFHVATPTDFTAEDYARRTTPVAVGGVLGILRACAASGTVRRVVYTSSVSAVLISGASWKEQDAEGKAALDESAWTDVEFCKAQSGPFSAYSVSKTLAERAALDFAEEHGLDVVTVLPSFVVGPFLVPYLPTSIAFVLALIQGSMLPAAGDLGYCTVMKDMQCVHIDDVAAAHVFLFECPEARGRYICSAAYTTARWLAGFLRANFPEFHVPDELVGGEDGEEGREPPLSAKKLKSLGFEFKYGLEEMFEGAIQCCKHKCFL